MEYSKRPIFLLALLVLLIAPGFATTSVTIVPGNIAPIDSNIEIDSGLTMGFNGAYPSTLSEGGLCFRVSNTINLRHAKFNMVVTTGSPLGTFNAQIFASTGTIGTNCQPTGSSLVTSTPLVIGSINGDTQPFIFNSYFDLQGSTTYAVSIRLISCVKCDSSNYWSLQYVNTDLSIQDNIYYWNNPYAFGGPHSKLKYEIDGSSIVQLKNKYGYLDATITEIFNSFTVYANGTMLFDLRGFERQQVSYQFVVTSYGNGTLDLRFLTAGQVPRVVASLASSKNYDSSGREIITYSTNTVNDPLVLTFLGSASQQLFNAAVIGSFFAGLMFISIGALFSVSMYGKVRQGLTGEKPIISTRQAFIVGLFAIVGWIIVIVIAVAFGGVLAGLGI